MSEPKEPDVYVPDPSDQGPEVYIPEPSDAPAYYPSGDGPETFTPETYSPETYSPETFSPEGSEGARPSEDDAAPAELDTPLAKMRREYTREGLTEEAAGQDPLALFARWLSEAQGAESLEPNAMTLATVGPDGSPAARMVLLKGLDARGFVFFTNYHSRKGNELASRPRAALVFFWAELERQVRVEGAVEPLGAAESDEYFHSRPLSSRIGAWASRQSEPVASREAIEAAFAARSEEFAGGEVPRPPHWGGYRVVPECVEFWQGRRSRMHDRLRYRRSGLRWLRERLMP